MSGAINWFFENEEQGVILEDDCVPSQSFFSFCSHMLLEYKEEKKVFHITGTNDQRGVRRGDADFFFSHFPSVWGWATWKDRWMKYDRNMSDYPKFKKKVINHFARTKDQKFLFKLNFDNNYYRGADSWAFPWVYYLFKNEGLSIVPNLNLISNIGFGENATHTTYFEEERANQPTFDFKDTLRYPSEMIVNKDADDKTRAYLEGFGLYQRTKRSYKHKLKRIIISNRIVPVFLKRKFISDYK